MRPFLREAVENCRSLSSESLCNGIQDLRRVVPIDAGEFWGEECLYIKLRFEPITPLLLSLRSE